MILRFRGEYGSVCLHTLSAYVPKVRYVYVCVFGAVLGDGGISPPVSHELYNPII